MQGKLELCDPSTGCHHFFDDINLLRSWIITTTRQRSHMKPLLPSNWPLWSRSQHSPDKSSPLRSAILADDLRINPTPSSCRALFVATELNIHQNIHWLLSHSSVNSSRDLGLRGQRHQRILAQLQFTPKGWRYGLRVVNLLLLAQWITSLLQLIFF